MQQFQTAAIAASLCLPAVCAQAIDVVIDYSLDTNGFFSTGTSDGLAARTALEQAATDFSALLTDTFSMIQTPEDFESAPFSGVASWEWNATLFNPATGSQTTLTNLTIAEDEFRVFAGGRSLSGNTLGFGGPGGFGWSQTTNGGFFSSSEIAQIEAITDAFEADVEDREETSGFANWGGMITFDTDGSTNWHFGLDSGPMSSGQSDFYSVAVHELTHALGFGASSEWDAFISSDVFTGPSSVAEFGGNVPLDPPDGSHWAQDTASTVFGTSIAQEASLDPNITTGTRKLITDLDVAGLEDIGWSIDPSVRFNESPSTPDLDGDGFVGVADLDILLANWGNAAGSPAFGDADGDGLVGQSDLDLVLANFGTGPLPIENIPEPTSLALLLLGLGLTRRRRA